MGNFLLLGSGFLVQKGEGGESVGLKMEVEDGNREKREELYVWSFGEREKVYRVERGEEWESFKREVVSLESRMEIENGKLVSTNRRGKRSVIPLEEKEVENPKLHFIWELFNTKMEREIFEVVEELLEETLIKNRTPNGYKIDLKNPFGRVELYLALLLLFVSAEVIEYLGHPKIWRKKVNLRNNLLLFLFLNTKIKIISNRETDRVLIKRRDSIALNFRLLNLLSELYTIQSTLEPTEELLTFILYQLDLIGRMPPFGFSAQRVNQFVAKKYFTPTLFLIFRMLEGEIFNFAGKFPEVGEVGNKNGEEIFPNFDHFWREILKIADPEINREKWGYHLSKIREGVINANKIEIVEGSIVLTPKGWDRKSVKFSLERREKGKSPLQISETPFGFEVKIDPFELLKNIEKFWRNNRNRILSAEMAEELQIGSEM